MCIDVGEADTQTMAASIRCKLQGARREVHECPIVGIDALYVYWLCIRGRPYEPTMRSLYLREMRRKVGKSFGVYR